MWGGGKEELPVPQFDYVNLLNSNHSHCWPAVLQTNRPVTDATLKYPKDKMLIHQVKATFSFFHFEIPLLLFISQDRQRTGKIIDKG